MELSQACFDELRAVVHRLCGLAIAEEKAYLVRHRLEPVVRQAGCRTFEEFVQKLRADGASALHEPIVEAITTNETSFFRDGHPFEAFRTQVLPKLGDKVRAEKRAGAVRVGPAVRIWCAAASTGQEPYSLAMQIHDYAALNQYLGVGAGEFSILATDVSSKVLAFAAAGVYPQRDLDRGLTPVQIARFFEKKGTNWVVREPLRRLIEFRRVNLAQPFGFLGRFDAIFCRNVLIYFDEATRRRIVEQFADLLPANGCLMLGSAENLYGLTDRFESERFGETILYRKK